MHIEFPISKDEDGFIWRQCPACEIKFKWHDGPVHGHEDDAAMAAYYCPICGHSAAPSEWFTCEQIGAAENAAMPKLQQQLTDELSQIGRRRRKSLVQIDWNIDIPETGTTQLESHDDDFEIVVPPCHTHEPVKVPVGENRDFHCLACGSPYRV